MDLHSHMVITSRSRVAVIPSAKHSLSCPKQHSFTSPPPLSHSACSLVSSPFNPMFSRDWYTISPQYLLAEQLHKASNALITTIWLPNPIITTSGIPSHPILSPWSWMVEDGGGWPQAGHIDMVCSVCLMLSETFCFQWGQIEKSLGSLAEFGLCFLGNGEQPQTLEKFIQV